MTDIMPDDDLDKLFDEIMEARIEREIIAQVEFDAVEIELKTATEFDISGTSRA